MNCTDHNLWTSICRMRTVAFVLLACLCGNLVLPAQAQSSASPVEKTYEEWNGLCSQLPTYKALHGRLPPRNLIPLKTFSELDQQISNYFALSVTSALTLAESWVGPIPGNSPFFNPAGVYQQDAATVFQPFAQKLMAPSDAEIYFHGDLHGDIHSLLAMLNWMNRSNTLQGFRFTRTNTYLIVLGDFTDRGIYSTEVLYTLLRLKQANPARVFLCRGNHEDRMMMANYGFLAEGRAKYREQFDAIKVSRLYDFLPVVIYLGSGTNFIQCNHGGMEPGYRPSKLLDAPGEVRFQNINPLTQKAFFAANTAWFASCDAESRITARQYYINGTLTSPTEPQLLGFMWNDFTLVKGQPQLAFDSGRGFIYGDELVRLVLTHSSSADNRLRAVFRGHQHSSLPNPMMNRLAEGRGLFRHWQAADSLQAPGATGAALNIERGSERGIPEYSVWTFNVAPDTSYGIGNRLDFDTFGILRVANRFTDWKIRIVNQTVGK